MIKAQWEQFVELANPDENGISEWVTKEEWEAIGLSHHNGSGWCQTDRGVGRYYTFDKRYAAINGHRCLVAIRLTGLKNQQSDAGYRDHSIPAQIRRQVVSQPCAVLYINSQVECDHKDGRYTNKVSSIEEVQPLNKTVNDAKRHHCEVCRLTGKRFDARVLGYSVGWIEGDENSPFCAGCYWNDPKKFNAVISQGYKAVI